MKLEMVMGGWGRGGGGEGWWWCVFVFVERLCSSSPLSRPFVLLVGLALFQGVAP